MRILFAIPSLSSGGAERVLSNLANFASSQGNEIGVILLSSDTINYQINDSITIIKVPALIDKKKNIFKKIKAIRMSTKSFDPDAVVCFLWYTGVWMVTAMLGTKYPIVTTCRNNPYLVPNKWFLRLLRNLSIIFSNGCIFQTQESAKYFDMWIRKKGVVIPNPVTNQIPDYIPYSERDKIIVSVGRLNKQKNQKLLIESFSEIASQYPEYELHIYGEGDEYSNLKEMITLLNLEGRVFLQGVSKNVIIKVAEASLFVLTSDYEGMPNALIESLAVGTPSIATNCPMGPSELIHDNINGLLVPVGNKDELVIAMKKILDNSILAESISNKSLDIREKLSINKIYSKYLEYLNYITKK